MALRNDWVPGQNFTAADANAVATQINANTAALADSGTVGPVGIDDITDAQPVGKALVRASSQAAARTAIGAGTSNLALGTSVSTAKAGNYQPAAANISDATATGRSVITAADAASGRAVIEAASAVAVKQGDPWWTAAFQAPISDDTPTITVDTSGAITGGTSVVPTADYFGDTHFRYDMCTSVSLSAGLVSPVQPSGGATFPVVPEFVTSGGCDKVDVIVKTNAGASAIGLRLIINGRWLNLPLTWFTATASTLYYIRLTFPTAKARSIRVETTSTASFGGVVVPSGETVSRPAREVQKRMVVIGDSYAKGANSNTTNDPATNGCSVYETFVHYVAKLLGCDSIINLAVGGTGWVDDNAGADSTFGARIADVLAASPHILLAVGSRNDSAYTPAQIYAAATSALGQYADIPVVEVCGPEDDGVGSGTLSPAQNEAVKQAARTAGRRFNDMIGVVTTLDKNLFDTVHPSVLGAQKLAKAFYGSLDRTVIDGPVSAAVAGRASSDLVLTGSPSTAANTGVAVTFTATLSSHREGVVSFYASGVLLGTGTVTSAVATYTSSAIAVGSYIVTARFRPSNPILVKSVTSNALAYAISANLGFVDHFTGADGVAPTTTENGKAYTTSGTGTWNIASNKLANPTLTGTTFRVAEAGTPNGTLSVTIGGTGSTGLGAVVIMRYVDASNSLNLTRSGNEIAFNKRITNVTTQVAISTGTSIWVANDVITVVMDGDTFTVQKNGTNVPGLVGITCSDLDTATKHGIGTSSSGTGATFDDLTFVVNVAHLYPAADLYPDTDLYPA